MTGAAGSLHKKLFARDDGITLTTRAGKPRGVFGGLHDRHPAAHQGVIRPAILRTEEMITAGLGGTEPHGVVMAGYHVHLHAECRNEKIMDDIFAGHNQSHISTDRNV